MAKVLITPNAYGFGMDWILSIGDKRYWLGQDVKVCSRVLGAEPMDIVENYQSETGKTYNGWGDEFAEWLGDVLVGAYSQDEDLDIENLESWELAVE